MEDVWYLTIVLGGHVTSTSIVAERVVEAYSECFMLFDQMGIGGLRDCPVEVNYTEESSIHIWAKGTTTAVLIKA